MQIKDNKHKEEIKMSRESLVAKVDYLKELEEMMEEINGRNVRIYEGGNSPAVREVEAKKLSKAKISVPKNDGVVIVFTAE